MRRSEDQLDLFPEPDKVDGPKCLTCRHWERCLTNYWGPCSLKKTWEMEWATCDRHEVNP